MIDLLPPYDLGPLGLAFSPFIIPAIAAAIKGVGSFLGNKSKQKKESAAASETHRANTAQFGQAEDSRIASLRTLQNALAGRGINLGIDPSGFEKKPYVGADPSKVAEAGRGSAFWSSLLGGAGDIGLAYGQSQQMKTPTSAGQPVGMEMLSPEEIEYISEGDPATSALIRQLLAEKRG